MHPAGAHSPHDMALPRPVHRLDISPATVGDPFERVYEVLIVSSIVIGYVIQRVIGSPSFMRGLMMNSSMGVLRSKNWLVGSVCAAA